MKRLDVLMALAAGLGGRQFPLLTDNNRAHSNRVNPRNSVEAPILNERLAAAEAKRARKCAKRLADEGDGTEHG